MSSFNPQNKKHEFGIIIVDFKNKTASYFYQQKKKKWVYSGMAENHNLRQACYSEKL